MTCGQKSVGGMPMGPTADIMPGLRAFWRSHRRDYSDNNYKYCCCCCVVSVLGRQAGELLNGYPVEGVGTERDG